MHYVTEARHVAGHKIKVRFEDGQTKLVDLGSHLDGPIFEPLRDPAYFRRFTVNSEIDTVVWPNNADFSPDFLYEIGQVSPDKDVNFDDATAAFTVSPESRALSCCADLPGDSALYAVSVRRLIALHSGFLWTVPRGSALAFG